MNRPIRLRFELLFGLSLRAASAVASFAITFAIARLFNAEAVGLYQIGMVTATFASLLVSLGLDVWLVRAASSMLQGDRRGEVRGLYQALLAITLRTGVVVMIGMAAMAAPIAHYVLREPAATPFLLALAPVALLLPLMKLATGLLRSLGSIGLSQSLEGVSYSTITLLMIGAAWLAGRMHSPLLAAVFYVIAMGLSVATALWFARKAVSSWPLEKAAVKPWAAWAILADPLAMQASNWLFLLAIVGRLGVAEAGIYQTAFQICMLFQLVNASFAMMAGPHLSREASAGNAAAVRSIIRNAGWIGIGLCLPLAGICILVPAWTLGLFGSEFAAGALALQVLALAQIINVGMGPVGTAMVMMGREKIALRLGLFALLAGLATLMATIDTLGMAGASLGFLVGTIIRNAGAYIVVRRILAGPPEHLRKQG